jgi:hypothetical protein
MFVHGRTRALLFSLFCSAGALSAAKPYYPPPDSAGGWRTLKDAAQIRKIAGMDVKRLEQAFQYTTRTSQHGGLLVLRHGWLVYENYYGKCARDVTPSAASVGKTFTSISCGLVLQEYKDQFPEGLDTQVFTREVPAGGPSAQRSPQGRDQAGAPAGDDFGDAGRQRRHRDRQRRGRQGGGRAY